jgi:pyruvate formate lyase activating enzyme
MADEAKPSNAPELPEIRGFLKSSLLEWEGKVVSVVYLPGCNLSCKYCHNWGLVAQPEKYEVVPWADVRGHLAENRDFLDGVCVTGGEPTIHAGLGALLREIRATGLLVKLDTNGTNPSMLRELLSDGLVDFVALDVKAPLDGSYAEIAGDCDVEAVRESIGIVLESGIKHEFRTTLVPEFHNEEAMRELGRALGGSGNLVIQRLVPERAPDAGMRALKPHTREEMERLADAARPHVASVVVRGG